MKRDSIIFYRSFYEAIKELPLDVQATVYSAIFEYSLNFNEIELAGLPKTIFTLIKPQLDANNKRFENGLKGGRKKANNEQVETEKEPKRNQNETKVEANKNVNDNVNINDNDINKKTFKKSLTKKLAKISFEESVFFETKKFAETFNTWPKEKLRYYYDLALRLSKENSKYVNWDLAVSNWAKKDELNGRITFKNEKLSSTAPPAPKELNLT